MDGLPFSLQTSCVCAEGYSGDGHTCEMINLCRKVRLCPTGVDLRLFLIFCDLHADVSREMAAVTTSLSVT